MNNTILIFLALSLFVTLSCKNQKKSSDKNPEETGQLEKETTSQQSFLTALPADIFKKVYAEADYLDVIFENLPFSMSQENNASIRQILNHVDNKPPQTIPANCPLFGQQLYMKNGEIILEADFFHSEGCYYYIFKHNGKKYYNGMTQTGITFFDNLKKRKF